MSKEITSENTTVNNNYAKYLITILAVGGIIALRLAGKEVSWTEIALFTIGVLPWFSNFMDSFKFGKDGFEAVFKKELEKAKEEIKEDVKAEAEKIKEQTTVKINEATEATTAKINEATEATDAKINEVKISSEISQSLNTFGAGGKSDNVIEEYKAKTLSEADDQSDPQKGKWGGNSNDDSTHRKLSARIEEITNNNYFRRVILRVESTDPANFPLTDSVTFHLHPTFAKPLIEVKPFENVAEITLVAWGAFTVGAETDNGASRLELDLANESGDSDDPFFKR
jgi:transcription initiation factor IIF auxiliary subunit